MGIIGENRANKEGKMKKRLFFAAGVLSLALLSAAGLMGAGKQPGDVKITGGAKISGGSYNLIKISGSGEIAGDVKANEFHCSGSCEVKGGLNTKLLDASGSFRVDGAIVADQIQSTGLLKAGGKIDAHTLDASGLFYADSLNGNTVTSSGSLKVTKDVAVKSFESSGGVEIGGKLSADRVAISIFGQSRVAQIKGKDVEVKLATKIGAAMEVMQYFAGEPRLKTDKIEGDAVTLENVDAKLVVGRKVKIGPNCIIDAVEYQDTISVDSTAKVGSQTKK
jgi:cytoskeletal protein CcmA (bactofilin family)